MNQWQIGKVKVTRIVEIEKMGGTRFILPQATKEAVLPIKWLYPYFMSEDGRLIMSIHALIVDTGDRRIMVDTCIGNDKERSIPDWDKMQTTFLQDITDAGYPPQSIDTVLCTHLHVDHVGWNTMLVNGKWEPTFKNARYLLGKKEWDYSINSEPPEFGDVIGDSVQPVVDAGLVDFVEMNHKVCDEVSLFPTPGHTPGHVSIAIESGGKKAVITGDSIHHPCQIAHTDWSSAVDDDGVQSKKTRENFLADHVDTDILIIGTHFATPTAGHIIREGDGYRLKVLEQD